MDLGIKGKRVLVTAASKGIGRGIALAFAKEGCRVAVVARSESELKAVVEEMGGQGSGHEYYVADLMADGAVEKTLQALSKGGAFDIVIHNLGGTLNIRDHLSPAQQWLDVWKLNVGVAIEINNKVVPSMQKNRWGRIVHISSTASKHFRGAAPYGVTKAYLNAYTESLGGKLAHEGIVVSAVMCNVLKNAGSAWDENTEANRQNREDYLNRKEVFFKEHQPIGRLAEDDDITPFVLFMSSEQARFAAGSIIPVTGGGL
jgi:3-oxoacyl-[acyl-carrier protein] reductase